MFRDVTVCLLGMLCCAPALGADCNIGEYTNGDVCTVCPEPYVHSMPNADGVNDCYLITAAGKYVPAAGMTEVACPENHYCPGGIPVFYGRADRLRRIEYIKSTGTQYIDTGILLGSDIDTEMVFENGKISLDNAIFGSWISERHYWLNGYNNMAYIRYNDYHPVAEAKGHLPADVRLILGVRHGDWILDGKTIYSNSGEFDVDKPGYLFAVNGSTGVRWIHKSLKVYSFTQWQKDKKVIELIPVYDSVKDECGMLDLVTGKLFENVGTGKFECGAFVDDIVGAGGAASCAAATDNVAPYSPAGTEDMSDCGRVLRFSGNYNLYLRSRPRTTHSLKVKIGGNIFYGDSTDKECGRLRVKYNGQTMSVCNMDSDV
ncbi:MAG: hypothetical protein K2L25_03190 [Alphaproteobacteria bacterium]|nr:hypothetical protein [Alphaproteobacteria bacterium]